MSTSRLVVAGTLVASVGLVSSGAQGQGRDPVAGPGSRSRRRISRPAPRRRLRIVRCTLIYSNGYFVQFTAAAGRAKTQTPREKNDQGRVARSSARCRDSTAGIVSMETS